MNRREFVGAAMTAGVAVTSKATAGVAISPDGAGEAGLSVGIHSMRCGYPPACIEAVFIYGARPSLLAIGEHIASTAPIKLRQQFYGPDALMFVEHTEWLRACRHHLDVLANGGVFYMFLQTPDEHEWMATALREAANAGIHISTKCHVADKRYSLNHCMKHATATVTLEQFEERTSR